MINCPHSIYFFRDSVDNFGLMDEYKGDKTAAELTVSPNPLLKVLDVNDYYRATEKFTTPNNGNFFKSGVEVNKGDYVKIGIDNTGGLRKAKFSIMGDSFANTLRDWYVVPLERPVVNPPERRVHTIELPGINGVLDLSKSLVKYPLFNNRTGSWNFAILNEYTDTPTAYNKMLKFFQGSDIKFVLEDDPLYYYEGRVFIDGISPKADGTWTEISLGYDLSPYKVMTVESIGDWPWDKFIFNRDEIAPNKFKNLQIPSNNTWVTYDFTDLVGIKPVVPEFLFSWPYTGTIYAQLYNHDLGVNWKEYKFTSTEGPTQVKNDLILCEFTKESEIKMRFRYEANPGSGQALGQKATVSVKFRSGRL